MEGRKESKYNISGTCPECGKLIKVEHTISVDLVELGKTTKTEESPDGKDTGTEQGKDKGSEGSDVRPADEKGPTTGTSKPDEPADSKKSKRAGKTGGK
ncbi:hypothetical protein LCGC14_1603130 [marine sediment metagenome]|uniref:Uncharacterized protein n=1 Tax=marine sediment metagenome TaxID=412755 RepID=A0A0F9LAM9_9ZZZZ